MTPNCASSYILPQTGGQYRRQVPLASKTWFRVGGCADVLFKPATFVDLQLFLSQRPPKVPYMVLGVGSNLLVREGGIRGVVIRLGLGFQTFIADGAEVEVGAGMLDRTVAENCYVLGIGGLEFLSTIPGTIGGALRMNAGAYGQEIKDCLVYALVMDPQGELHRLSAQDLGYGYRSCSLPPDWVMVGARLRGAPDAPEVIRARMDTFAQQREATQPTRGCTGGSTFANPEGIRAWEAIDQAGCRGLRQGGAVVSPKHCNFLMNEGTATAADLENLGEEVRARVLAHSGIDLRWEIVRVGETA